MENLTLEVLKPGQIEECRALCDALMAFQKAQATLWPECFDGMSFDTRMKPSYQNALRSQVILARDGGRPAGYVFSTVDEVEESARHALPDWAPKVPGATGFYPPTLALPQKIGCLNNLYLYDAYRGLGLGRRLLDAAMAWLTGFSDVSVISVFISNGNRQALDFYLSHGFKYSHEVFGGFIQAAFFVKPDVD